jgi:eukaryotic-like serine/threonine-protein kinase
MIGTTLGHYRIESQTGQGGMGVVYRARDTQLDRPVAIKLLRADAVADPDRKRRFIQEARAASALNHPNIVTIYHIGSDGAADFIAMEFVGGRSLDQVISGRSLPLPEALRHAIQIALALGAAHDAGIVHRDLKPGNVMVTDKGQVKLLDFGLAKLTEPAPQDADMTATHGPETGVGLVVGTAAYMSPEQAQGLTVDRRTDIYAFGVLLHEMLTGRRPVPGASPDPPGAVPRDLRKIVARCLRPDPVERFQNIDDARMALEDADLADVPASASVAPRSRGSALWTTLVLVAAAGAAGLAWWLKPDRQPPRRVLTRLTMDSGLTTDQALSPDGRLVAFASDRSGDGNLDIWVRQVAGGDPVRLTSDPADDSDPSFSPDGSRITFRSDRDGGGIYVISTLGGNERRIVDHGRAPRWSPAGTEIVCWTGVNTGFLINQADAPRIFVVAAGGGEPRRLFPDFAVALAPVWSADGTHLIFLGSREAGKPPDWWVAPLDGPAVSTGAIAAITRAGLSPSPESFVLPAVWKTDGRVIFSARLGDSTNLWQIRVPLAGSPGSPERLTNGAGLESHPSAGPEGRLVFSLVTNNIDLWSLPIETSIGIPSGPMKRLTDDPATDAYPSFSPDGGKLVFMSNRSGSYDLWVRDMSTGKDAVIAAQVHFPSIPIVTKDGSRVVFPGPARGRWFSMPLASGGAARTSTPQVACDGCPTLWDFSADGKWAVYERGEDTGAIVAQQLATGQIAPFLSAPGDIIGRLRISPDDRWAAFVHRSAGAIRVVVVPFRPGTSVDRKEWIPVTPPEAVSNMPTWSLDSGMVYYLSDRDGRLCLWAQHIDRNSGHPAGDAFPVWHFHEARRSPMGIALPVRGLALTRDRIVLNLSESTGNLWMAAGDAPAPAK